jgi:hypothetical protein
MVVSPSLSLMEEKPTLSGHRQNGGYDPQETSGVQCTRLRNGLACPLTDRLEIGML